MVEKKISRAATITKLDCQSFLLLQHLLGVVVVVVARIYPPVTGQRQTLTYWTIRSLFITTITS